MAAHYDLDFVLFHCEHPGCREVFEKSLNDLAGADEAYCPRCGQAARVGEGTESAAAAAAVAGRV